MAHQSIREIAIDRLKRVRQEMLRFHRQGASIETLCRLHQMPESAVRDWLRIAENEERERPLGQMWH